MVKMSDSSLAFLKKYLPSTENAENPNDILGPLYDLIMDQGFVSFEKGYNSFGIEAQEVYDDVFHSNFSD